MAIPHLSVAEDMCVNLVVGRCIPMDIGADSAIQIFLGGTPQY
jgi:hypothetical protein